jgi:quercetin dioxygenase-like cupin family protein
MTDTTAPTPLPLPSFDPDTFAGWSLAPIIDELLASEPAIREGKSARTLIKAPGLTVVLTVLRAGQQLHEHKAPGSVLVVPLRGAVVFSHADQRESVAADGAQVLAMGPGLVHAVTAETDSAFLLVIGARG